MRGRSSCWRGFRADFVFPPEIQRRTDRCFKLLGTPIGTPDYCNKLTQKRATKAQPLLDALTGLPDPQVALILLRHCTSFGKMVYSARTTPFEHHMAALQAFDAKVRSCFEGFMNTQLGNEHWARAVHAVSNGGVGLRSLATHSPAAYLASRSACHKLCKDLDQHHHWEVTDMSSSAAAATAVRHLNAAFLPEDQIAGDVTEPIRQQKLSLALDKASAATLKDAADLHHKAHHELVTQKGACGFLTAMPSDVLGNVVSPDLFRTMVLRWLRVPFTTSEFFCPFCDTVCDIYMDHALCCSGGGDRTKRHNLVRNQGYRTSARAGLCPELEKPGLLQPRPLLGSRCEEGTDMPHLDNASQRRPADVFLPRWCSGGPAALDFAITSGLQIGALAATAADGTSPTTDYQSKKRNHLDTENQCREAGLTFIPMVAEGVGGGWGNDGQMVWNRCASAIAAATGEQPHAVAEHIYQNMSIIIHKEGARAVLRRLQGAAPSLNPAIDAARLAASLVGADAADECA